MPDTRTEDRPTIMIIGLGDLSCNVLNLLACDPATNRLVLAGRDVENARRRANLVRFAAHNLGHAPEIAAVGLDLDDIDRTAATLAEIRPDIVFMGASLQSWRVITGLPKAVFEKLDDAQFGPWLPMHLTLNHKLMQAVSASGIRTRVVNAAFPDAVGPVLAKVGLAPTIGIGNVANIIPALTHGVAQVTGSDVAEVEIRLVTQHYFSHYVPRFGDAGRGAYHLTARIGGRKFDGELDHAAVFAQLDGRLKRIGGVAGQFLTAASAVRVLRAMATDSGILAHAPAPGGLPGGYPVRVYRDSALLDLDESLDRADAIRINEACQQADGIERIEEDGTVVFTEPEMAIMKSMLGYECRRMALADSPAFAEELAAKYRAFAAQYA